VGGKMGGRPLKNPVRHFSLNWHPSEQVTADHMVETVQSFLKSMGWSEHQALIVCHDDRHPHVHVMVNSVHPETGRALDAGYAKRRAQKWAERYEREHGIFCEERLKPVGEREASPTRESWQRINRGDAAVDRAASEAVRQSFDYFKRNDAQGKRDDEWIALKDFQREQRIAFFEDKQAFREAGLQAYREVRMEFRGEWRSYYAAKKAGRSSDELAAMKADILTRQNKTLDERRAEAHAKTLEARKLGYAQVKRDQQSMRDSLRERQQRGQQSHRILNTTNPAPERAAGVPHTATNAPIREAFRGAAEHTTQPPDLTSARHRPAQQMGDGGGPQRNAKDGKSVAFGKGGVADIGLGALGAIAAIGERLFDGFFGGGEKFEPPAPPPQPDHEKDRQDEAQRATASQQKTETRQAEEAALLASWAERRQKGRARD